MPRSQGMWQNQDYQSCHRGGGGHTSASSPLGLLPSLSPPGTVSSCRPTGLGSPCHGPAVPRESTASEGLEKPPLPGFAGEACGASLLPWESSWKPCVSARAAAARPSAPRAGHGPKAMTGRRGVRPTGGRGQRPRCPGHSLAAPRPPGQREEWAAAPWEARIGLSPAGGSCEALPP